jgi:hypothetical protein
MALVSCALPKSVHWWKIESSVYKSIPYIVLVSIPYSVLINFEQMSSGKDIEGQREWSYAIYIYIYTHEDSIKKPTKH